MMQISAAKPISQSMPRIRAKSEISTIKAVVCAYFAVTVSEVNSPRRHRRLTWPRFVAIALVHELLGKSYPDIGRRFGGRDHTSAMHAVGRVAELRAKDAKCEAEYTEIKRRARIALGHVYVRRKDLWGRPFVSVRGKGRAV